jgi:hypothetical protein
MLAVAGLFFVLSSLVPGHVPGASAADVRAATAAVSAASVKASGVDHRRESAVEVDAASAASGARADRRLPRAPGGGCDGFWWRDRAGWFFHRVEPRIGPFAYSAAHQDRRQRFRRPGGRIPRMGDGDPPRA